MKTILEVNGVMNRGGAEMMLMELIRKLKSDFKFIFLINRKKGTNPIGDFDEELKSYGIPIYYIDAVWDVGIKEYRRQFANIINEIGHVDVVHSHLNSKGGIISKCAYKCGIKRRIVHSHAKIKFQGNIVSRTANYAELYIQRAWINRYATDYWGCSSGALTSLFTKKHRESSKAQIIHNAVDLELLSGYQGETIREELGISKDTFLIGTVGRIAEVKNYELAADVISELWKKGIDCHYVIAGREQSEKSVAYVFDKLGDDSRFHYLGVRDDLPKIYHGLDLYLGTSLREGLGLTAVEAQACGVTCILSAGFPDLCDVKAGLVSFVNDSSISAWVDAIKEKSLEREKKSMEIVKETIRKAGFDVETEAARVKKLYDL